MPQQPQYLSTDPSAGTPVQAAGGYLSTDPNAGTAPSWVDSASNFVSNFAHTVNPAPAMKLLYDTATGLGGMLTGDVSQGQALTADLKQIGQAQLDQFKKGKAAYDKWRQSGDGGDLSEAVGHTFAGALPLIGPAAARAGEQIGSGDISGGAGAAAGLLAPFGAKYGVEALRTGSLAPTAAKVAALKPVTATVVPGMGGPANPVAAGAADFAQQQGIPMDAATATGSGRMARLQKIVGESVGGGGTAEAFTQQQRQGLATIGEQLAAKTNAGSTGAAAGAQTAESAGAGALQQVAAKIDGFRQQANTAYDTLRQIEQDPANLRTVPQAASQVPMAVDMGPAQDVFAPVHQALLEQSQLAPATIMGQKATALTALNRLMTGPQYVPLSTADGVLSDLKRFAYSGDPATRTAGQAAIRRVLPALDAQVQQAAADAGPQAAQALQQGRAATTAKYAAQDVRDFLEGRSGEPVQAYGRVVARNDTNIESVRDLARLAPDALPAVGRAFLDDVMQTATQDGGFDKAKTIATQWNKLGPQTKQLLFQDPTHVAALDNFFRVAQKMTENVNPSGSGSLLNFFNPAQLAASPAMYGLSKLLYTPRGVNLLTQGLKLQLGRPALAAAYGQQLAAAAQAAGVPGVGMAPVFARGGPAGPGQQ